MKQIDVAAAANITHVALSRFESGKSTLSRETLMKIAPLLNINPQFLQGDSANPFHAKNLIKMSLSETLSGPNFDLIYFLAEVNQRLDLIYLLLPPVFGRKLARVGLGGGLYTIAIAIRDGEHNYFIVRPKLTVTKVGEITGLQEMQTLLEAKAAASGCKPPLFTPRPIDSGLLKKIQSWTVERADIEPLFGESQIEVKKESMYSFSSKEKKIIKILSEFNTEEGEKISERLKKGGITPDMVSKLMQRILNMH